MLARYRILARAGHTIGFRLPLDRVLDAPNLFYKAYDWADEFFRHVRILEVAGAVYVVSARAWPHHQHRFISCARETSPAQPLPSESASRVSSDVLEG